MYAAVKFIATILSLLFFIDRLGRRKLLLISSIGTSLSLWYIGAFITASHVNFQAEGTQKTAAGWVAIVCVYVYGASFSFAWNGVVWVYCAEIFPTRIKDLAVCLCTAAQWLSQVCSHFSSSIPSFVPYLLPLFPSALPLPVHFQRSLTRDGTVRGSARLTIYAF
jgi:MFS family permease